MLEKTMYALWNYEHLTAVRRLRKECRAYAEEIVGPGTEVDKMFKDGAFRITKVTVTEI